MRTKDLENTRKQEEKILEASAKCFIEKGFHQTSMRDIAKNAKMSLGGIYRYFKGKNDIIMKFVELNNQEGSEAMDYLENAKNFKRALKELLHFVWKELAVDKEISIYMEIIAEALRNKEICKILLKEDFENKLADALKAADKENKINLKLPADIAASTILSALEKAAYMHALDSSFKKKKAYKIMDMTVDLVLG